MRRCDKEYTFKTKGKAYYAMLKIPVRASGQVPFRIYWCQQHKGFHITSKAIHKGNARNQERDNGRRKR
jgi:hypothetical protein